MKKQVICGGMLTLAVLGGAGMIVASEIGVRAEEAPTLAETGALAMENNLSNVNFGGTLGSKNETVYVMAGADGATKSTFIGSTLYSGNENLPFEMKVRYYLDGTEVSATEIAGKTGRVKIVFNYDATVSYQGKKIPFVAVTGAQLDKTKFSNIKLTNGKIVSENGDYLVMGYGVLGANEDLETDFLPGEFAIEADVKDFALGTTYTILMNELIAEIDTSKLTEIDSLISQMNELESGTLQLISGAETLTNETESVLSGAKELYAGARALSDGVASAVTGAEELSTGLTKLTGYNDSLTTGATSVFNSLLDSANATLNANATLIGAISLYGGEYGLSAPITLTIDNYGETLDTLVTFLTAIGGDAMSITTLKTQLNSYNDFYSGLINYTTGVETAAEGSVGLAMGLSTIAEKAPALTVGLGSLIEGEEQLYAGSVALQDGLGILKISGIDKLVNFANNDLAGFTRNARQMVTAAGSYRSFGGVNAESVKFIIKTTGIK